MKTQVILSLTELGDLGIGDLGDLSNYRQYNVDGNQKSGEKTTSSGTGSLSKSYYLQGLGYIQTVVGNGISEPSTSMIKVHYLEPKNNSFFRGLTFHFDG